MRKSCLSQSVMSSANWDTMGRQMKGWHINKLVRDITRWRNCTLATNAAKLKMEVFFCVHGLGGVKVNHLITRESESQDHELFQIGYWCTMAARSAISPSMLHDYRRLIATKTDINTIFLSIFHDTLSTNTLEHHIIQFPHRPPSTV